jgi:hypothetical protein
MRDYLKEEMHVLSLARRAADKALGMFLPKSDANADTWGRYCYCFNGYRYYERWSYGSGGVPVSLGCRARYNGC